VNKSSHLGIVYSGLVPDFRSNKPNFFIYYQKKKKEEEEEEETHEMMHQ